MSIQENCRVVENTRLGEGLYLMVLLGLCLLCAACAMRSLGSPLTAPLTPHRPGNPDLLIRFPLWFQKARGFFAGRHA